MNYSINPIWHTRRSDVQSDRNQDHRSPFQRDRARILHSAAFRRLQSKTQVMGVGQSDFYRTRLTHSLEAAQIGSGIIAQLKQKFEHASSLFPSEDSLIESICLAHDIGHPPFGHGGEVALNFMMRNHGGFEGNGQTFRILTKLEPYSLNFGMNLSRRTLLGVLKYPEIIDKLCHQNFPSEPTNLRQLKASDWKPAKGIYADDTDILSFLLAPLSASDQKAFREIRQIDNGHSKTLYKSLDCSVMELADDIAYGVHDLEDAIVTGIVSKVDFQEHVTDRLLALDCPFFVAQAQRITDELFSDQHHLQKDAIGALVNYLITSIKLIDMNETDGTQFDDPILRFNARLSPHSETALKLFKGFVFKFVISLPQLQRLEYRGQQVVMELFEAFNSDPMRLLPANTGKRWLEAGDMGANQSRVIADYISGMTDEFATKTYRSLFLTE